MFTLRRVVIVVLVVGGIVAIALVFTRNEADVDAGGGSEAVEALIPGRNAETLSQTEVGVDLAPGWTGVLILNDEELAQGELNYIDALNQVLYRPEDGLESGRNCVRAVVWRSEEGRDQSRNVEWCFEVT